MYNYNEMIKMGFITKEFADELDFDYKNEETNQIAIKCVTHCPYIDTCGCCCAEDYNDYDMCGFSEYSWKIQ